MKGFSTYSGVILVSVLIFIGGCDMFKTRNPETPDTGRSSFLPPTGPDIVISNFVNAIEQKNTENYVACFSNPKTGDEGNIYIFSASADATARYPGLFDTWNIDSERGYFNSLVSQIPTEISPVLMLTNNRFDILSPDSAVYIADYLLFIDFVETNYPKKYSGTFQLSIAPHSSGNWSIYNWQDIKKNNDTIPSTWSILKGQFSN